MEKQTSARVSSIAGRLQHIGADTIRLLVHREDGTATAPDHAPTLANLVDDIHALAGSALGQDEHKGQEPENFYDRLLREEAELSGRIDALTLFAQRGFPGVKDEQRELLECQLETMRVYRSILKMRLHTIPEPDRNQGKLRLASESEPELDEPREIGGHDPDRDGPISFGG